MGLHRETNAVVQIHFLPGQVRGPPRPIPHASLGRGVQRHLVALGLGLLGGLGTAPLSPASGSWTTQRAAGGLLVLGSLSQPARGGREAAVNAGPSRVNETARSGFLCHPLPSASWSPCWMTTVCTCGA